MSGSRPCAGHGILLAAAIGIAGCASLAPVEGPPIQGLMPASSAKQDTTARTTAARASVPADSLPSRDAQDVLATIPEPLAAGERVPPPDTTSADTSAAVPTPAPTRAMGDSPAATGAPPVAPAAGAAATGAAAATSSQPDTCWRVQVGAPETADEAEQRRQTAESLLMTGFVVDTEEGRFKVRTQKCADRTVALAFRDRAIQSGFAGAFLIANVRK